MYYGLIDDFSLNIYFISVFPQLPLHPGTSSWGVIKQLKTRSYIGALILASDPGTFRQLTGSAYQYLRLESGYLNLSLQSSITNQPQRVMFYHTTVPIMLHCREFSHRPESYCKSITLIVPGGGVKALPFLKNQVYVLVDNRWKQLHTQNVMAQNIIYSKQITRVPSNPL